MTMQYLNLPHWIYMILMPVSVIVAYLIFRNKSEKAQRIFLYTICFINIGLFIIYKTDKAINHPELFDLWADLPLQLCNMNLYLMPIALKTRSKTLYGYLVFVSLMAAALGILSYDQAYVGRSPFDISVMCYFVDHIIIVVVAMCLVLFGYYKPTKYENVIISMFIMFGFAMTMHSINVIFRATGLSPNANYFVSYGQAGNFGTEILMKIINVPLLYMIPTACILLAAGLVIVALYNKFTKKKA